LRHEDVRPVVVDDGSGDPHTIEALARLERSGVEVVRQPHGGLPAALMAGVRATASRYLFRLDADDIAEPGAVAALADALDADPEAALAWGDIQTFGLTTFRVPSVPVLDPWHVTLVNVLPAGSMFRRSALVEAGGWRIGSRIEDWDLLMALAERGCRGIYLPRVVYRYRRGDTGVMANIAAHFDEYYEEIKAAHPRLFAEQARNRRRSPAPWALKALLPLVAGMPGPSRLTRVQVAQVLTHVFWNGGIRAAAPIVAQGIRIRLRGPGG